MTGLKINSPHKLFKSLNCCFYHIENKNIPINNGFPTNFSIAIVLNQKACFPIMSESNKSALGFMIFSKKSVSIFGNSIALYDSVRGKMLEGEKFGELLLMKQMTRRICWQVFSYFTVFITIGVENFG